MFSASGRCRRRLDLVDGRRNNAKRIHESETAWGRHSDSKHEQFGTGHQSGLIYWVTGDREPATKRVVVSGDRVQCRLLMKSSKK
jgi:hypothetical protein